MDTGKQNKHVWIALLVGLVIAIIIRTLSGNAIDAHEKTVHVKLERIGDTVTAQLDDGEPLSVNHQDLPMGDMVGLYTFHSYQDNDQRQHTFFSNIRIRQRIRLVKTFARPKGNGDLSFLETSTEWDWSTKQGLYHNGTMGSRAVCLLKDPVNGDFSIEMDITRPVDAGIAFMAEGTNHCALLVIRAVHNDMFFTTLNNGEPGPVLAIAPFKPLRIRLETLRLAGLVADQAMRACLLLLLLIWASACITIPDVKWMKPIETRIIRTAESPRFLLLIFLISLAATSSMAIFSLGGVPHIADESAYLFQARIFAGGKLSAPAPALPEFFEVEHVVVDNGKWFGKYPPGYPALLAIGVKLGVPWMINPILASLSAILVFLITKLLTQSVRKALLALVLMITSPFYLFISACMMSHAATFLFFLLSLYLLLQGLKTNRLHLLFASGAALGIMIMIRPYMAFLQFWPLLLLLFFSAINTVGWKRSVAMVMVFGVSILFFAVLFVSWNASLTPEQSQLSGTYVANNANDVLGFGPDKGRGWLVTWGNWGHTPAKALRSVGKYLNYTSTHLFGWPLKLSLCFAGIALFGRKRWRIHLYLFASILVLVIGHMFYWATQHIGYGARYWYTGLLGLLVLSAEGVGNVVQLLKNTGLGPFNTTKRHINLVMLIIIAAITWNAFLYLPSRIREGYNYANVSPRLKQSIARKGISKGIVFVATEGIMYNDGFFMNDPFMRSELLYARDLGTEKNRDLIAMYPDYPIFYWDKHILKAVEHE